MKTKRFLRSALSMLLAVCLAAGAYVLPAKAADTYRYVTVGASNTNGYGMRGYITEEELDALLSGEVTKDQVNVYGYKRAPEGAYTDLVRDYLGTKHDDVELSQLAISSMRAEELRVLLDNDYYGDDYTAWRFTGNDGWFATAEPGGLDVLRASYQDSIKNADLITVDIGWNNFGVYICNQVVDYLTNGRFKWNTDINEIYETDAERAAAQEVKAQIGEIVSSYVGEGDMADAVTDIFAYSYLGYIYNFDICMEKIYELNPDADVVVLGIQNLLHGVNCSIAGIPIPLGDIFGNFVNMANYYISSCSPYESEYLYVKAGGDDEHVTLFLDDMKSYDGDAANLDQNVKDCFDYYDNDLYLKMKIEYVVEQEAKVLIEEEYGSMLKLVGYTPEQFLAEGKKGTLPKVASYDLQQMYNEEYLPILNATLNAAYDTVAQLVKEIANLGALDVSGLLSGGDVLGQVENDLMETLEAEILENAQQAGHGEAYTVDIEKILPDDLHDTVAAIYIRFYMGNSFFAHPSGTGHKEICDAITGIIENPDNEKEQPLKDELKAVVVNGQKGLCTAAGHYFEEVVTKATTKKSGKIEEICKGCGEAGDSKKIYYPKTIKLSTTTYTYNGKVKKPSVTVTDSAGKKISSSNYTVKYASGRKYVGKYSVKITFKGNYSGSVTTYFKIKPMDTELDSLKKDKKAITVKWDKVTKQISGYQIQYSTSSKFTESTTKSKSVTGYKTTSKKLTGLKAKKKYYVRVRVYKTVDGTKYYSDWSNVKSTTTK